MYDASWKPSPPPRQIDGPVVISQEARSEHALRRARQLIQEWSPGSNLDPLALSESLAQPYPEGEQEVERLFLLGWLSWLSGDMAQAASHWRDSLSRAMTTDGKGEAAYWLARSRIRLGEPLALADFEQVLRTLEGSPQATCWFVDLLWRMGHCDRAEQVWKAVRTNRRAQACPEIPLLEARSLLHQRQYAQAEQILKEAQLSPGALQAERLLLLAWADEAQGRREDAQAHLTQARDATYPEMALQSWRAVLHCKRGDHTVSEMDLSQEPTSIRQWQEAQSARSDGDVSRAAELLKAVEQRGLVEPFARYAETCLEQGDFAALLEGRPGNYLAVRCRLWQTIKRFCRRKVGPEDVLGAVRQARQAGYQARHLEAIERMAQQLQSSEAIAELPAGGDANQRRANLERFLRSASPAEALPALVGWSQDAAILTDGPLAEIVGKQLLRSLMLQGPQAEPLTEEGLSRSRALLIESTLPDLAESLLSPRDAAVPLTESDSAAYHLWALAVELSFGLSPSDREEWHTTATELTEQSRARPVAMALLACEAILRRDVDRVVELLRGPGWSSLSSGPPRFLAQGLQNLSKAALQVHQVQEAIQQWLRCWPPSRWPEEAKALAGLTGVSAAGASPEMLLYEMGRSWQRGAIAEAIAMAQRAMAHPNLDAASREKAEAAAEELQRLTQAERLSQVLQHDPEHERTSPFALVNFADLLSAEPEGKAVLEAAEQGEWSTARMHLAGICQRKGLPPRLSHHLAVASYRNAFAFEQQERMEESGARWRESWLSWIAWMASPEGHSSREQIIGHLLKRHRQVLKDLLARGLVDSARHYWNLVMTLPEHATDWESDLAQTLRSHLQQFRDDLAMDYLLVTRDVLKADPIPEGWRSNYDSGLVHLRRLLSLDRENQRLLTALVEICSDWFLDLYDTEDSAGLQEQIQRFTPFALQLARMMGQSPDGGDLSARAALSQFYKFRGFIAPTAEQKMALYREALEFNPANENVQQLLSELEGGA